ncbi:hypothetical protein BKA61DRAFT_691343 [Leptodontidium sp. MPI-SDFR-AT-0119]|nr:hypothetical protein BKA61DRAFT_691343 [Leptodontidium sp. MPI-SDFR-AT-0119]
MDHLTHIDEPDLPPLRVPYLGESGFKYDGLGFLQFPQRCGLSIETMIEESWLEFDLDGNASFLQAYLYFGFLHEFFSRAHVAWGAGDFICEETCGSRITTKFLPLMIWFWVSAEIHTGPEERESRIEKYSTLFDMIEACMIALTTKDRVKFQKTEKYCHKGSLILSSVTILFEALGKAFRTTYFSVDEGRMTRPTTSPFYVDVSVLDAPIALIDRLLSAGWCRGEIQNLEHESLSCSSMYMYILGSVQRSRLQRNHEKCTKMKCNADQVDKTTYKTKHQIDECQCSFYPQSCTDTMEKICRVLDSGNLPLIKIPQSKEPEISDLEIEVVSYNLADVNIIGSPPLHFIAISHVWADGKGNQTENRLPKCVLRDLQSKCSALYPDNSEDTWWWVDTLCIPIHEPYRRIGIERLVATYSKADKVLILDKGLEMLQRDASPEEKFLAIRICGWMQRLWTMQEGWLAPQLYFQFSDGALQGFELLQACTLIRALVTDSHTFSLDASKKRILEDSYRVKYPELPTSYDKHLALLINKDFKFDQVVQDASVAITKIRAVNQSLQASGEVFTGLKGRTTSRLEDEPICIANLLGLDSGPIIREKPGDRMKLLLRTIHPLPTSIIFSHGERMLESGYRWAPRTFLVPDSLDYRDSNPATFKDERLTFELPGISLNLKPSLPHNWELHIAIGEQIYCLSLLESDDAEMTWDCYQNVPMMVILRRSMQFRGPVDSVLVSFQKTVDDTLWVLYERTLWIAMVFSKPKEYGSGVFLSNDQRWCITDTPVRMVETSVGRHHVFTRL